MKYQLFQSTVNGPKQGIRGEHIEGAYSETYVNKQNKERKRWFIDFNSLEELMNFVKKWEFVKLYTGEGEFGSVCENIIIMTVGIDPPFYPDDFYDED